MLHSKIALEEPRAWSTPRKLQWKTETELRDRCLTAVREGQGVSGAVISLVLLVPEPSGKCISGFIAV